MDLGKMWKIKQIWDTVSRNHPKLPPFVQGVSKKGICEGTEIAVAVRYPDGTEYKAGIRVTASDLEQLEKLRSLKD